MPQYRLLEPSYETSSTPLIICFHGSGDSCASWEPLVSEIAATYRILLIDRGEDNPGPPQATNDLISYLTTAQLQPPFVLVAHSYGGTFAKHFLHSFPDDVAGMVLAETGQETALDPKMEQELYRRQSLGDKPLSVIRGNMFIGQWAKLKVMESRKDQSQSQALSAQRALLALSDTEDEKLKKAQLALSRNHRFVQVPDCGHHVIRDRPDVVAAEIRWVMENVRLDEGGESIKLGLLSRIIRSVTSRLKGNK